MLPVTCITLLSDLGTRHTAISGIRALAAAQLPASEVIDISHSVTPYNLHEAAYMSRKAALHFPEKTVHLLMVDIDRGERHRMLLARSNGQYFIAPDNGILAMALASIEGVWLCSEFQSNADTISWAATAMQIIISIQAEKPDSLYSRFMLQELTGFSTQRPDGARIDCNILHIDRYGNIIVNFTRHQFDSLIGDGPFSVALPGGQSISHVSQHYSDKEAGNIICRFNSQDYLELGISHGSLSDELELYVSSAKGINYSMITIHF